MTDYSCERRGLVHMTDTDSILRSKLGLTDSLILRSKEPSTKSNGIKRNLSI